MDCYINFIINKKSMQMNELNHKRLENDFINSNMKNDFV